MPIQIHEIPPGERRDTNMGINVSRRLAERPASKGSRDFVGRY